MRFASKLLCNFSIILAVTPSEKEVEASAAEKGPKLKIQRGRISVPAGATLELDDKQYAGYVPQLKELAEEGSIVWLKKPAVSKEAQAAADAKALAAAKALVADSEKKASK